MVSKYAKRIALAKLAIEEAGMIPKVIFPTDSDNPVIRIIVDVEATIKSQSRTEYEMPEYF